MSLQPAPPRAPTTPSVPNPMTNMGVMSDYGAPSGYEEISDIKPDFSWLSSYEIYVDYFTFSSTDPAEKELTAVYPMAKEYNSKNNHRPVSILSIMPDWHFIPFCSSRWWSGKVQLRFMAIKPKDVTGKLLLRWFPDVSEYDGDTNSSDTLRRKIKYEWDLGQSNEYSMTISGYNTTRLRPTWIPYVPFTSEGKQPNVPSCGILPPLVNYTMGVVSITVANPLQPGSLYPDSIRILVFHSFPDSSFHTSVDVRGDQIHMFGVNGPPDWDNTT